MADFSTAWAYVAPNEGGYSNQSWDSGGPTNFGITQATAQGNGYQGDMRDFTLDQALAIYQAQYWPGLDDVDDQDVANVIFDQRINGGMGAGNELAQNAANDCGQSIAVDGHWGPATLAAVNACDPNDFLRAFASRVADRYQLIVAKNPKKAPALKGWLNRAQKIADLAVETAGEATEVVVANPGTSALVVLGVIAALVLFVAWKK